VADEIAQQVRQNQNHALITLDPPELGGLRIMLTVDGDKVQARIIAQVHESGNMIQNHLPELKEALQGHRLDLVDVHIDSGNWNSAGSNSSQNFGREFGAERRWRGGKETTDTANDGSPITPNQAAAPPSGRISRWA
jgi:flagellar hook-length control protein FliK